MNGLSTGLCPQCGSERITTAWGRFDRCWACGATALSVASRDLSRRITVTIAAQTDGFKKVMEQMNRAMLNMGKQLGGAAAPILRLSEAMTEPAPRWWQLRERWRRWRR